MTLRELIIARAKAGITEPLIWPPGLEEKLRQRGGTVTFTPEEVELIVKRNLQ